MGETGRAAVYAGKRAPFDLREYPVPEPGSTGAVVRVAQTNLCGSDLHMWRGELDLEAIGVRHGVILGHEMVGRVHRLGAERATDALGRPLAEGDRVVYGYHVSCGRCRPCVAGRAWQCALAVASPIRSCDAPPHFLGGFADYYYLSGQQPMFAVPDELPDIVAAGVNCALSQIVHGYDVAGLRLGERVVVQGAGGLGLFACCVARELGAGVVVALDAVPARLAMARRFGADATIDVSEVTDARARVAEVQRLTEGGADVVVEVAGLPDVIPEGLRMLERGGRYLEMGNISPRRTFTADPSLLVASNRSVLGVSLYPSATLGRALDFLVRTRDRYPYEELVSHRYPLSAIDAAFAEADALTTGGGAVTRAAITPMEGDR